MEYIGLCTGLCFLWGLWIKSFRWASVLDVNRHVHYFGPKLQVKFLCMNHASSAFHDGYIGSFRNSILLWCVRCTCLSLDSTFMQKVIKLFGHKFSSIVKSQGFDPHAGLIIHQGFVCLEFVKHLSFHFQKVNMSFFSKSHRWRWQSIMLHHEMWFSLVRTHHYAQVPKAWKP